MNIFAEKERKHHRMYTMGGLLGYYHLRWCQFGQPHSWRFRKQFAGTITPSAYPGFDIKCKMHAVNLGFLVVRLAASPASPVLARAVPMIGSRFPLPSRSCGRTFER